MPVRMPVKRNMSPRNRRSVAIAENTIKRVAPLAQEQYNNALIVDGIDSIIYNRLTSGRKCSCSRNEKESPSILDEDGNATETHINELLEGSNFGIRRYNEHENPDRKSDTINVKEIDNSLIFDDSEKTFSDNMDDMGATQVDFSEDDFILEQKLGGHRTSRCGVCYSQSFIGGYNVFNGTRQVYDTTYFELPQSKIPLAKTSGVTIDKSIYPFRFELTTSDSFVDFQVTLPKQVISLDVYRVMNNFDYEKNAVIQISLDGISFIDLNTFNIFSYATGLPCVIRVSNVSVFTHLELQFNCSKEICYISYPRLNKTGDLSVIDPIDPVSLIVSPLVPDIQPWDIIADNVYGRLWRVTNSNWFNDKNLNNHGWDIQARLVQEYEIYHNLYIRKKLCRKTTNFNR